MDEKSVALYFTEGGADKVYQAQLKQSAEGFVVNFQYGRRGKPLKDGTKTAEPVSYEVALKKYNALVKQKTSKGYTENESGEVFTSTEHAGDKTSYRPQLLNTITDEEARRLGDDWLFQQKHDGERRGAILSAGEAVYANRRGLAVGVNEKIAKDVERLKEVLGQDFVVDGEDMGDNLIIFDIPAAAGLDENATFADRAKLLAKLDAFAQAECLEAVCVELPLPASVFFSTKHDGLWKSGAEGYVARHSSSTYVPGRPSSGGDALKRKFIESCTVRVKSPNGTKRSVALEMMDAEGQWVGVGNVTIPANADIPKAGDLIEVEYMYAYKGGSLYQPVYNKPRTDVDEIACKLDSLFFNNTERAEPAAAM